MSQPQNKRRYTYSDYLDWNEDERIELIDGEPFMQTTPSRVHQGISAELMRQLTNFLKGRQCKAYSAPFSVRLDPRDDNNDETILEPDITVICDNSKLDAKGCRGVPDMIIEILSPATAKYDCIVKFQKYLKAGVRE